MTELTDTLKSEHEETEEHQIYFKEFSFENRKVRYHCHYIRLDRRAAQNNRNPKYQIPDQIPIVFHKLSGYDVHMLIKKLGTKFSQDDIIKENKKKYISFYVKINIKFAGMINKDSKGVHKNIQLRFIDSCRFLSFGLDQIVCNVNDDQCNNLREFYKG